MASTGAIAPKPHTEEDSQQDRRGGEEGANGRQYSRGDEQEEGTPRHRETGTHTNNADETRTHEPRREDGRNVVTEPRNRETEEQSRQRIIKEIQRDEKWEKHYGDQRDAKDKVEDHLVRILTYNIGSFPKIGSIKQDLLKRTAANNQIIGFSELNTNWTKIGAQDSVWNRTERWYVNPKTQVAWLCDPSWPSTYQQGGVSLTIQGHVSPYVQSKGTDITGLGRWAWYTLEGRSAIKTAVIQIYRPCRNTQDNGSSYMQQKAWTEETNPIEAFDRDVLKVVDDFRQEGFQIIVMGDVNQRLEQVPSGLEMQLNRRGIIDQVRQRYGPTEAPNTHYRGSAPIDAIFASETIEMVRGGYDPGEPGISDHRSIWCEITINSLLGVDRGVFEKPLTRKLQIKNKKVTKRFNKAFEYQLTCHRMEERAEALWGNVKQDEPMTEEQQEEYERLDRQRERAVAYANDKCARTPSDKTDFSPQYQEALGKAHIWAEVVNRMRRRGYVNTRWLIRMKARWGIQEHITIPTDLTLARKKHKQAKADLQSIKAKAPDLREDFLENLIRIAEDNGEDKKAKDLRQIRDRERLRKVHTRIKAAQGKLRGGGVKFVERINEDGTRTTIKDKDEMETEIMKANEQKLQFANESPLRQGDLGEKLTDSNYKVWEQFLAGTLTINNEMEEGTRKWLDELLSMPAKDEKLELTDTDYVKSWRKPREHTACAPGPMHYGTFKAMTWSKPSARLHTIMAAIPIKTGYTPKRWAKCTDSMLPKKKDEWRPSKLRLTALLPPDFNHNNKILGRAVMEWAEQKNILAPEQYGSRKKLSAAKHALNKRLVLDILRIKRKPGVICANDAKACYDRILHFAAYTALRRAGLTEAATTSMLRPIQGMTHNIRTAYGDSKIEYGGDQWDRDPSGICQGNGAGPAIWALVSSPLLKMLRKAGYGAKLHAAIGDTFIHLAGFAFVDDADTIQTGSDTQHIDTIVAEAQDQLTLWEQGLRATGGGIEGSKSDFAVIDFKWDEGQWQYAPKNENHTLSVPMPAGGRELLKQTGTSEARRTLGVWQAPDGNEIKQMEKMTEKASEWSRNIRKGFLSRQDIAFGVKTSLYPSITYGLMATALTDEQCKEVFKPVRANALGPMGYNRTIPALVVHGPTKYGGMGLKDLYSIQGIEHVKAILDDTQGKSPTASLLEVLHMDHVLEIGRKGFLYDWDYKEVEHLMTDTWIKHTLRFISDSDIQIEGPQKELETWRHRDSLFMDDAHTIPGHRLTRDDMVRANRCRQYLQVTTRSDIATGNGAGILPAAWRVEREWHTYSASAYTWPNQGRPGAADVRAWQKVLHVTYGVTATHLGWARQLGEMKDNATQHIEWRYDRTGDHLYHKTGDTWRRWTKQIRRSRSGDYIPTADYTTTVPTSTHPAVVTTPEGRQVAYLEGYDRHTDLEPDSSDDETTSEEPERSLLHAIQSLDTSIQWVLEDCEFPEDNGMELANKLRQGTLEVASDGSLKDCLGTAAGTTKGVTPGNGYRFWNRVPGEDDDQSSYRSELCGILGHVIFLSATAEYHKIQQGSVTISSPSKQGEVTLGCDNEAALWAALGKTDVKAGDPCFDILRVIHYHVRRSKLKWNRHHVYGHQDTKKPQSELDPWALANIETDHMADEHWHRWFINSRIRPRPQRMPGEGWRVVIQGQPIVTNIADKIYAHRYKQRMITYWKRKGRILNDTEDEVDWNLYEETIKITPRSKTQWTYKHFSGFEGNNYMLHKFGDRDSPRCPMCEEIEKHTHIVQCKATQAADTYEKLTREYSRWLHDTTSTSLAQAIIAIVEAYRHQTDVAIQWSWPDDIREAAQLQNTMGPRAFMEGLLHQQWEGIQEQYLGSIESRRSPRRWMRLLVLKTWMVSWDMWDARNAQVHDNAETRRQQIGAVLDAEIRDIHDFGSNHHFLPRVARDFFATPLDDIMESTDYQKRIWNRLGNKYLENDTKRMQTNEEAAGLREWLIPGSSAGRQRVRHREDVQSRGERGRNSQAGNQAVGNDQERQEDGRMVDRDE